MAGGCEREKSHALGKGKFKREVIVPGGRNDRRTFKIGPFLDPSRCGHLMHEERNSRNYSTLTAWWRETIFLPPRSRGRNDEAGFDGWIMEGLDSQGWTHGRSDSTPRKVFKMAELGLVEGRRYLRLGSAVEGPQLFGREQVVRAESIPETVARVESNQPQRSRASSKPPVNPSSQQAPIPPGKHNNTHLLETALSQKVHPSQLSGQLRERRHHEAAFWRGDLEGFWRPTCVWKRERGRAMAIQDLLQESLSIADCVGARLPQRMVGERNRR